MQTADTQAAFRIALRPTGQMPIDSGFAEGQDGPPARSGGTAGPPLDAGDDRPQLPQG